jgi:predicted amidophosphoribosyltransferase
VSLCPACGAAFRKGKRRPVLFETGELLQRLVCLDCARLALSIVPKRRALLCKQCPPGDTREGVVCARCSNDAAHRAAALVLGPFAERLRNLAKAYRLDDKPQWFGLEMAADMLESASKR